MTLDLNRLNKRKKNKRKKTLSSEIRSGYSMLIAVVITLNLVLGISYFMINSQKAVLGYKLNQLKITNDGLRDEAKKIDGNIVDVTAFKNLQKNAKLSRMVEAHVVQYSVGSSRTARNR